MPLLTSFCTSGKIFWAWIPALPVTLRSQTIRAGVDVGVNDQLATIHTELLQMKEELEARLFEYSFFQQDSQGINSYQQVTLMYHVKEELQDVLLALSKIENGTYGICEETNQAIPLEKMAILPTARTANDFLYHAQFEKKTLPIWAETDETFNRALYS